MSLDHVNPTLIATWWYNVGPAAVVRFTFTLIASRAHWIENSVVTAGMVARLRPPPYFLLRKYSSSPSAASKTIAAPIATGHNGIRGLAAGAGATPGGGVAVGG